MLVLLKNHLNYLNNSIFECCFKKYNKFLFKKNHLFTTYNDGKFKSGRVKHN